MIFPFLFTLTIPAFLFSAFPLLHLMIVLLFGGFFSILYLVCKWRLFTKAGQKGWKALIPFYSTYVFIVKICGIHWVFFALFIAGLVSSYSIFASILITTMCFYNLAKRFNSRVLLVTLCSILFAPIIIMVYGLQKEYVYDNKIKVSNCGYFNQR